MGLPIVIVLVAAAASALLAFGTNPYWGQFHHGIEFILWSRRLQWPLLAISVIFCLVLLVVVIAGKRRQWWLIVLVPVLWLIAQRFWAGPATAMEIADEPTFIPAADAKFLGSNDYVVGLKFQGSSYAFPFSVLYGTPVVLHSDRQKRMMLVWSVYANKATAITVNRELRGRDLEVVSLPANALLLYNSRVGQFINGITGRTPTGLKPSGFGDQLEVTKRMWADWREENPTTMVMAPRGNGWISAPKTSQPAKYPLADGVESSGRRICLVATSQPVAMASAAVTDVPLNIIAGDTPVLVFRDQLTGDVRGFDRRLQDDLRPRFAAVADEKNATAVLVDADTNTEWTAGGAAVAGPRETRGKQLKPVPIEDDLDFDVMKYWFPDLRMLSPAELVAAVDSAKGTGVQRSGSGGTNQRSGNNSRRRRRNTGQQPTQPKTN